MNARKDTDILNSWINLESPKPGYKMMLQFLKTNLWVFKTSENSFGFLITNTFGELKSDYKNIVAKWEPKFVDKLNNITLKNCLIIETRNQIDSKLFCKSISSLFEKIDKYHLFKTSEIDEALIKMEEITLKESDAYNEVIGVWGELFLINELVKHTTSEFGKHVILDSWESNEGRSIIDINIKSKKTKIEIKTTIEHVRSHHFHGLSQVHVETNQKGFLASICVVNDENGLSCLDLVNSIEKNTLSQNHEIFHKKIKIRGAACKNNKFFFSLNPNKKLEFFKFQDVPKPSVVDGIGKIEWVATLENKTYINNYQKNKLLAIMT